MAIPKIITRTDFVSYIDIAANLVDAKLFPRIIEAQNFNLCELMGNAFFYDFMGYFNTDGTPKSDMPADYLKLYTGGTFTHCETTYQQDGLKPIIVYFTGARLLRSLDLHITPNGIMQKRNEYSDHIDTKAIGSKATEYENIALAYWNKCKIYIDAAGKVAFPKWKGFDCIDGEITGFRSRVYGVTGEDLNTMGKVFLRRGTGPYGR